MTMLSPSLPLAFPPVNFIASRLEHVFRLRNVLALYRKLLRCHTANFCIAESKNVLFDPQHGTYLNGQFGAFTSPLLNELLHYKGS